MCLKKNLLFWGRDSGSCKNNSVLYTPYSVSPVVISYVAVIEYENQEVGIGTFVLTRL